MKEDNPIELLVQYNESVLEEAKAIRLEIAELRELAELGDEINAGWDDLFYKC